MPRILRTVLGDGLFHVWSVAVDRTPAFADDVDRISFLRLLAECVHGYEWEMYAWCLMTTHYHLVVDARQPLLSAGMQRLNSIYAQRINRRRERNGHVFRGRFSSRVVEGEEHAHAVCPLRRPEPGPSRALPGPGRLALELVPMGQEPVIRTLVRSD